MAKLTFKMNPGWEKNLEDQIRRSPLQQQVNAHAQEIVRGVDADMKGGNVDAIHQELIARISAEGAMPNVENLLQVAHAIADGELV